MGSLELPCAASLRKLLAVRAIRFAIVGGAGVPISMAFLWLFYSSLHVSMKPAWVLAFACSALINFYANQTFTFREQNHLRGWDWPVRAAKAQVSSLAGLIVNASTFSWLLHCGMHYLPADGAAILAAFSINFLLAKRFVYLPELGSLSTVEKSSKPEIPQADRVGVA